MCPIEKRRSGPNPDIITYCNPLVGNTLLTDKSLGIGEYMIF